MKLFLPLMFVLLMHSSLLSQQVNRFGQPRAMTKIKTIKVIPTFVLPGLFVQIGGVEVDMDQLRRNRIQRKRWRHRR